MATEEKKIDPNVPAEPKEPVAPVTQKPSVESDEDDDDTELLAMKEQVQKKIDEKKTGERTFTQKDMDEMASKLAKKFSKQRDTDEDDDYIDLLDPDARKRKFVRIARLNNKFVIGLKDMNKDSYTDQPIYITNIKGPNEKDGMIPWATLVYDEIDPETKKDTELYPYLSFMNRAVGVWAEVLDEEKVDVSEKFGIVDIKDLDEKDEWNMKSTGKRVLAKALKYKVTYVVKEIKTGKELRVSEDVINKVEAPYSDLKKFLDATK